MVIQLISEKVNIIKKAMDERKSISAYYDRFFRKLSPYELGTKKGKYQCLFYQYGGESSSGTINGKSKSNWRCLKLNKLEQIQILDEPLQRSDIISHKRPSYCVDNIIKQIYIE